MFDRWGDKGCEYRPDKCDHPADDGCMWCCMTCNLDRHLCPGTCNPCIDFTTGAIIPMNDKGKPECISQST